MEFGRARLPRCFTARRAPRAGLRGNIRASRANAYFLPFLLANTYSLACVVIKKKFEVLFACVVPPPDGTVCRRLHARHLLARQDDRPPRLPATSRADDRPPRLPTTSPSPSPSSCLSHAHAPAERRGRRHRLRLPEATPTRRPSHRARPAAGRWRSFGRPPRRTSRTTRPSTSPSRPT